MPYGFRCALEPAFPKLDLLEHVLPEPVLEDE